MNEVYLCLGGNLGDRLQNLNTAKALIAEGCGRITAQSKIYETEAWGSRSKKSFLNQVIKIVTPHEAPGLLQGLLLIEKRLGRVRTRSKNGDRIIDIDILFFNHEVIETEGIEIPHPRLHLRKFVLKPLADIDKDFVHPVSEKTIATLLKECGDTLKVRPIQQVNYICIEGNIGSGKTTLAKDLATKLNAGFLAEQFEKNDLLPLFYSKPELYAFPLEYSFLLNRYQQITDAFKSGKSLVVSDYSIYKCLWFAKVNLSKKDFAFFKKHFHAIESQLPKPDLIVYLDTSIKNLKKNIRARGRAYEKNIKDSYLEEIGSQYLRGLEKLTGFEKLILPVKTYNSDLNAELVKTIKNHIL